MKESRFSPCPIHIRMLQTIFIFSSDDITSRSISSLFAFLKQYIKVRIELSKNHLMNSTNSIAEIAITTGFDDPNYYSRVFTKMIGISPTEFRRRFKTFTRPGQTAKNIYIFASVLSFSLPASLYLMKRPHGHNGMPLGIPCETAAWP